MSTTTTTNIGLIKPAGNEPIIDLRSQFNSNMDAIDTKFGSVDGDISDLTDDLGSSDQSFQEYKALVDAYMLEIGRYGASGRYRNISLGTGTSFANASTAEQRAAIANGTFDGLHIGAYWTINGTVYRIADFNYWKRSGDSDFNTNHIVIVPDKNWGNEGMNSSNVVTGGYTGSRMYTSSTSVLGSARNTIATDFGGYLASHREYLANTVDSTGAQSAGAWFDSTVELMNEPMVYGCFIHAKPTASVGYLYTIDKAQLALFRLNPGMVNLRYNYWLRDVVSSTHFANVNSHGYANLTAASTSSVGVRVAFAVKGTV